MTPEPWRCAVAVRTTTSRSRRARRRRRSCSGSATRSPSGPSRLRDDRFRGSTRRRSNAARRGGWSTRAAQWSKPERLGSRFASGDLFHLPIAETQLPRQFRNRRQRAALSLLLTRSSLGKPRVSRASAVDDLLRDFHIGLSVVLHQHFHDESSQMIGKVLHVLR